MYRRSLRRRSANERNDLNCLQGTRLARLLATVLQSHQGRDAANAEPARRVGIVVTVDLDQHGAPLQLLGSQIEMRRHPDAGAAPGCPEVDQHRQLGALGEEIEIGIGQFDGPTIEQFLLAASADRPSASRDAGTRLVARQFAQVTFRVLDSMFVIWSQPGRCQGGWGGGARDSTDTKSLRS